MKTVAITAIIPTPSTYKNLAYTCLFITRYKSYTSSLNTECELGTSPYTFLYLVIKRTKNNFIPRL